jgi:squalene-hopene/tetraprenyl-beta-curcumene cyclase
VRRPGLAPSGWAFEFANDLYPDTDDTAEVLLALRRSPLRAEDSDWDPTGDLGGDSEGGSAIDADAAGLDPAKAALNGALRRGAEWMIGMQCRDGGWGAFDADNTRSLIEKLPFCDFGAVIDPPSADVTAHIVEALALDGRARHPATLRGVRWLLEHQEAGGSWFGRWGANHVYGTGAVVPALLAAGVAPGHPAIRRAVTWLLSVQNADGGWGEDLRSYKDPAWIGRGQSTASQTAWALLALLAQEEHIRGKQEGPGRVETTENHVANGESGLGGNGAGEVDDGGVGASIERAVAFLVETQRTDGSWDEDMFTGTGFPGDFYINYHLYRLVFPLTALGRYVKQRRSLGQPGVSPQLEVSVRWSSS